MYALLVACDMGGMVKTYKSKQGDKMTEKIDKKYLKEAAKSLELIYKKLGYSPNAAEYDRIAENQFKLRCLKKNNIKLNQLKEAAQVPKRKPGFEAGEQTGGNRSYIFCKAMEGQIVSTECVPDYKPQPCSGCRVKQKKNTKALPNIPEEIEQAEKYDESYGSKSMNGNDIYLTDIGVI